MKMSCAPQHLGPGQRERQEHGVARGHVGDRDRDRAPTPRRPPARRCARSVSAEPPNAARSIGMTRCSTAPSCAATRARGGEFGAVTLAVVEAERVAAKPLRARDREAGRRVESARDQDDGRCAPVDGVALHVMRVNVPARCPRGTCAAAPAAARRAGPRGSTRRAARGSSWPHDRREQHLARAAASARAAQQRRSAHS